MDEDEENSARPDFDDERACYSSGNSNSLPHPGNESDTFITPIANAGFGKRGYTRDRTWPVVNGNSERRQHIR